MQVLSEFASVLRRKFGFEWDVITEAIANLRTALDPVRPIDIEIHAEAEQKRKQGDRWDLVEGSIESLIQGRMRSRGQDFSR